VTEGWGKLHSEDFLISSLHHFVMVIKSRKM